MILNQLSVVLCFISAAKSMNIGYRDHLIGVGKNAQNELGAVVETSHLWDSALSTSKSNSQRSDLESDMIPEHSTSFSTEHTYLDKISFPKPTAPETSTLERNVQYNGELICRNTRVGDRPSFFGEIDDSNLKKYENLIDVSTFQGSSLGNSLMVADDQSALLEFHRAQNYESLARFKKRRLHDVLPERPFDQICKVSNPLYQINEGPFTNHANLPEGPTPFSNPYPQPNPEIHSIGQEDLAQSQPNHDISSLHARYSTGQKLKSPSTCSEDNNSNYDPFSESEFWTSILQTATPDLDSIFDKFSSIQSHHNFYSESKNSPLAQTDSYESVFNSISGIQFDQANIERGTFQEDKYLSEPPKISTIENSTEIGGIKLILKNNQFEYTPIGGLIDYKLNLYHIHYLCEIKSSEKRKSLEESKNLLSRPSFSYIRGCQI
ncbi:expressed protein [Phakopsora pachyrhizi]|uniref:Expressed protein n=1 Tax=Phakopsora pachyrhizi TaxID=170000 RepID=A0AAV0BVK8_PHAPC|nr:expressed protein [Phakopsora pachyrhizi]